MGPIRVEAIPTNVAERIRRDRTDGHGNSDLRPIHVDEHPGYTAINVVGLAVGIASTPRTASGTIGRPRSRGPSGTASCRFGPIGPTIS